MASNDESKDFPLHCRKHLDISNKQTEIDQRLKEVEKYRDEHRDEHALLDVVVTVVRQSETDIKSLGISLDRVERNAEAATEMVERTAAASIASVEAKQFQFVPANMLEEKLKAYDEKLANLKKWLNAGFLGMVVLGITLGASFLLWVISIFLLNFKGTVPQ